MGGRKEGWEGREKGRMGREGWKTGNNEGKERKEWK